MIDAPRCRNAALTSIYTMPRIRHGARLPHCYRIVDEVIVVSSPRSTHHFRARREPRYFEAGFLHFIAYILEMSRYYSSA